MHLHPRTRQGAMSTSPTNPPELIIRRALAADAAAVRELTRSASRSGFP